MAKETYVPIAQVVAAQRESERLRLRVAELESKIAKLRMDLIDLDDIRSKHQRLRSQIAAALI